MQPALDPSAPRPCPVCRRGCGCHPTDPGCGHYGCWGRASVSTCPGTSYELARYEATRRAAEQAEHIRHQRRARVRAGLTLTVPAPLRLA